MPQTATIAATCIGAAVPTIAMGLFTNYPFALAAGVGEGGKTGFASVAVRPLFLLLPPRLF